jgi:hypothetical protein
MMSQFEHWVDVHKGTAVVVAVTNFSVSRKYEQFLR